MTFLYIAAPRCYSRKPPPTLGGGVFQYDVGAGGKLSAKSPATVAAGPSSLGVAVSPLASVPTTKDQCKHGGWKQFDFKNQGRCIRFVNHHR